MVEEGRGVQAVILMGIQGSGKSTFFYQRFRDTHVRINLDMLRTRRREWILFAACLEAGQRFAIDNTNVTREDRERYIGPAHEKEFAVIGYYFSSPLKACLARNATRECRARIPDGGVRATHARLELPSYDEGFDELYYVRNDGDGFTVEAWR